MARYDLEQFLKNPKVRIVALCDVDATLLAAAKQLVPDARVYRDWRELLASEGDRLDSVNVSTPDHGHAAQIAGALSAGKHVYAQKPLCKYLDECEYLRELAASSGKVTQLGTQFAASANDRACVAMMRGGMLGPVKRITLFSTRNGKSRAARKPPVPCAVPKNLDWERWIGPAPMRPYAPGYHPLLWRMFTDFGSGWVGDLCIHVTSAPWQGMEMGEAMPISVSAKVDEGMRQPEAKGFWPRYSHIVWQMPGVKGSGFRPWEMEWLSGFSGVAGVPAEFLPQKGVFKALPFEGRIIETELAWVLVSHGWGEKTTEVVMKDGTTPPSFPRVTEGMSHFEEYVERCFDGKAARSDFAWSTRMMEAVIMGGVAEQLPDRELKWNAQTRHFNDAEANRLAKSNYRDGWKIAGLS